MKWAASLLRDLAGWLRREPVSVPEGGRAISHSADARLAIWAVTAADLVVEAVVDAVVPATLRVFHLLWVGCALVLCAGVCAMTARTPHLLDGRVLRLRTGPFRELTLPMSHVMSVRAEHGLTVGHGLRRSPDDAEAVACSVGSATTVLLVLAAPVEVRVRRGAPVLARRVRFSADRPAEAARLIREAAGGGPVRAPPTFVVRCATKEDSHRRARVSRVGRVDVTARTRAGWDWLRGPERWTRRALAVDLALVGVLVVLGLGVEELDHGSLRRMLTSAAAVALLVLLRRRLPVATLVVAAAVSPFLPGTLLVTSLLGWSAGRRIVGVGRALGAFAVAFVAEVGLSVVQQSYMRPLLVIVFSALMFLATTVMPGLASRYWSQRRTLLRALQERNGQLLRERAMVAGQARLRERQRIAQDMHDSLGHQLALISVHTGALEVDPKLTDHQREAVGVLRQASVAAMHELREVVGILRDGVEAPAPVEEAAQPAARGVAGIAGIVEAARGAGTDVRLTTSGQPRPLAAACDHAAYRIVQEALTNAYKHAPGARITVELRYEDDSLVVEIANGPAAAPGDAEVVSGGQGLTGLRERARLVGGMVYAGAADGGGFRVAGVLPYGAEPAGAEEPADDFGQRARPAASKDAPPMDWAAVDRELEVRGRSRTGGVALGCGIAFAAVVLLVIAVGAGVALVVSSAMDAMISRADFDAVRVGEPERAVRDRLPDGENFMTSGMEGKGPARPEGSHCLVLLSEEDSQLTTDTAFRFCFKDGKLVDKQAYEVEQ
ncbi:sensor histidine kinase [Streptomyces sp. A1136]|uniref:sensor histidine kinase n=1 Tax=Streptomyces sp. A1136 TaxID=2563102 RepID=UPI002795F5BD|nr:histidine kinase [Streptomyces sp. A1136]